MPKIVIVRTVKTIFNSLALLGFAVLFSVAQANTPLVVSTTTATDLANSTSYSPNGSPSSSSDIVFTNSDYSSDAFVTVNNDLTIGTLNISTTTSLLITNSSGTTSTLTLSGGSNSVAPSSADTVYLAPSLGVQTIGPIGLGTLNIALTTNAQFDIGTGSELDAYSVISGNNSLTLTGGGTLVFEAINTYTGATVINSGTLVIQPSSGNGSNGALASPTITVNAGGILQVNSNDCLGYQAGRNMLIINGGQVLNDGNYQRVTISNTLNMVGGVLGGTAAGGELYSLGYNVSSGQDTVYATSDATGAAAQITAPFGLQTSGTNTFDVYHVSGVPNSGSDLTISGQIQNFGGSNSLTKTGNGILTLTAANVYTGSTTVNAGTLVLTGSNGSTGALNSPNIYVNSGATLILTNNDTIGYTSGLEALTINDGSVLNNGSSTRQTIANTITMTGGVLGGTSPGDSHGSFAFDTQNAVNATSDSSGVAALISANISFEAGSPVNFNVSRGSALSTSDFVTPDLIISGVISNFYPDETQGLTEVGNGVLQITNSGNSYVGATTINGGVLELGNGGTSGALSTSSLINIQSGFFEVNRSNLVVQGADFTPAAITGSGGFIQAGTGTTLLNGSNTFTGAVILNNGTLNLGAGASAGSGDQETGLIQFNGGTLQLASNRDISGQISSSSTSNYSFDPIIRQFRSTRALIARLIWLLAIQAEVEM